jgi:uncharacterized protein YndB with AHSA1/START domain
MQMHIRATPAAVYAALVDRAAVQQWMVPDGMTSTVHEYEPTPGGSFRITLTYDAPTTTGKTDRQSDTFHGRFLELVPDARVVQLVEFETNDPQLQGEMTITYSLDPDAEGTLVTGRHDNLPLGLSVTDNELGWRMSMSKLAALVEARWQTTSPHAGSDGA